MYAAYFGLRQPPFSIAPDPRSLFLSERHREALAHLLYGVQGGGGFVLLTGEIGAGKTTVCRAFLEQVPQSCRVAYIFNPKLTVGDLLRTICHEFQIEVRHEGPGPATVKDYLDPLNAYLLACHAQGLQNLLIIDEAQNLTPHVLEQLRLLTNLETNERKLLQVILIGQPELRQQLAKPELEQLAQRVIARYHLDALTEGETQQYIRHRLDVAGLVGPVPFDDAAMARIHRLARGVPRRINLLCDRALLGAYGGDRRMVDADIVERAALEVFGTDARADAPPPVPRRSHSPLAALGLGVLGGAVVVALAALAVWQWPQLLPASPAAAPAALTEPSPTPAPAQVPAAVSEPATATAAATPTAVVQAAPTPSAPVATPTVADEPPIQPGLPERGELIASETAGWRQLGELWQQPLMSDKPCADAQAHGLQCFRTGRMTLRGLRQLDRPALLGLQLPTGTAHVLLTRMGTDTATLQAGDRRWRVSLETLQTAWQGRYATLWRTPPGTKARIDRIGSGEAARWIDQQLLQLQAAGTVPSVASQPAERLQAFQQMHGIAGPDHPAPLTFMLVNRLSGADEPRLLTP